MMEWSGVLYKQGDTLLQWNSRYFELRSCGLLMYWTNSAEQLRNKRPRGIIVLDSRVEMVWNKEKHAGKFAVLIRRIGKLDVWIGADDLSTVETLAKNIEKVWVIEFKLKEKK
jgi:hypothetical protein